MAGASHLAIFAVVVGAVVGVVVFVPFVAISHRRRGRLTLGRLALWAGLLVYFVAIWTYTLLPLPDGAYACAAAQPDPTRVFRDLVAGVARTGIRSPEAAQLFLNVVLFVPLGAFVRLLFGRGWPTALAVGLGLSLVVELTQLTGVWGLYPCAYRVFDTGDLVANTGGALVGSLVALVVPRRLWTRRTLFPSRPRPVTRTRKLLAMVCDLVGTTVAGILVVTALQLGLGLLDEGDGPAVDPATATAVSAVVVLLVWGAVTLVTGATIGDLAVELVYEGGPLPVVVARSLRLVAGIGGFVALTLLPGPWVAASWVFAVVSGIVVLTPVDARGLAGLASGQRLTDAREPDAAERPPHPQALDR